MLMNIPIGQQHSATIAARALREISCEHCRETFAYEVQCVSTGTGFSFLFLDGSGASERASEKAESGLQEALDKVRLPVLCPKCVRFQEDMCPLAKKSAYKTLGIWLAALFTGAALLFAAGCIVTNHARHDSLPIWSSFGSVALLVAWILLLLVKIVLVRSYDPNEAHPDQRRKMALGKAVLPERYDERIGRIEASYLRKLELGEPYLTVGLIDPAVSYDQNADPESTDSMSAQDLDRRFERMTKFHILSLMDGSVIGGFFWGSLLALIGPGLHLRAMFFPSPDLKPGNTSLVGTLVLSAMSIIGVIILYLSVSKFRAFVKLLRHGARTTGVVLNMAIHENRSVIAYSYELAGIPYAGVHTGNVPNLHRGMDVIVVYDPENPARSMIADGYLPTEKK